MSSNIPGLKDLIAQEGGYLGKLIAFDPGITTGWASFNNGELLDYGQLTTPHVILMYEGAKSLLPPYESMGGHMCVEDYRIYKWHAKDHSWSDLQTPKNVGILELLASLYGIPLYLTMAQQPKAFVTDEKLVAWNLYQKGKRHALDAIRHAVYHMVFYKQVKAAIQQKII